RRALRAARLSRALLAARALLHRGGARRRVGRRLPRRAVAPRHRSRPPPAAARAPGAHAPLRRRAHAESIIRAQLEPPKAASAGSPAAGRLARLCRVRGALPPSIEASVVSAARRRRTADTTLA